jgi:hypothetical protein
VWGDISASNVLWGDTILWGEDKVMGLLGGIF